jgi:hypothetical protein
MVDIPKSPSITHANRPGTWQDSLADGAQPPSNLTRFSRALSRLAVVDGEDGQQYEIPQIVYYQKGVGTSLGDKYWGGPQPSLYKWISY